MSSERRLIASIDSFVQKRKGGVRSKKHLEPLVAFSVAELRSRGVRDAEIRFESKAGRFYQRPVDLVVEIDGQAPTFLILMTMSGSVRNNLKNRYRDIVGDAVNLRVAHPDAKFAVIFLLQADEEATRKGTAGTSAIEELADFLFEMQTVNTPLGRPLLDAAALLAAKQDASGKICIEKVRPELDVLAGFFDLLI